VNAVPADQPPAGQPVTGSGRRWWPLRGPLSPATLVIAALVGLLGFALVVQVRSNTAQAQLATARPDDLVRILADLDGRQDRLREEITELERTRDRLASGAQGDEAALAEVRRRTAALGILAGTLPATGPGLTVEILAGHQPVGASAVLNAVQELRGAGAEAIQIRGASGVAVRLIASSYFADAGEELLADGVRMAAPFVIEAIGDPPTMRTALDIPGGVVDAIGHRGGGVSLRDSPALQVTALSSGRGPRYARPVR